MQHELTTRFQNPANGLDIGVKEIGVEMDERVEAENEIDAGVGDCRQAPVRRHQKNNAGAIEMLPDGGLEFGNAVDKCKLTHTAYQLAAPAAAAGPDFNYHTFGSGERKQEPVHDLLQMRRLAWVAPYHPVGFLAVLSGSDELLQGGLLSNNLVHKRLPPRLDRKRVHLFSHCASRRAMQWSREPCRGTTLP